MTPIGIFSRIDAFIERFETTTDDVLIILGDSGINYRLNKRDWYLKQKLAQFPITFLCLRGNHEEKPENISAYKKVHVKNDNFEADCYIEDEFPNRRRWVWIF